MFNSETEMQLFLIFLTFLLPSFSLSALTDSFSFFGLCDLVGAGSVLVDGFGFYSLEMMSSHDVDGLFWCISGPSGMVSVERFTMCFGIENDFEDACCFNRFSLFC